MDVNIQAARHFSSAIFHAVGVPEPDFTTRGAIIKAATDAEKNMRKVRVRLLYELANLSSDSPRLLKRLEPFTPISKAGIAALQDLLRTLWPRDAPLEVRQYAVDSLCVAATGPSAGAGIYAVLGARNLLFGIKDLPGQVLTGALEHWARMAHCANPECPAPYFFAKRNTQVYCERGECTKYAIRKKALKWWAENRGKNKKKGRKSH